PACLASLDGQLKAISLRLLVCQQSRLGRRIVDKGAAQAQEIAFELLGERRQRHRIDDRSPSRAVQGDIPGRFRKFHAGYLTVFLDRELNDRGTRFHKRRKRGLGDQRVPVALDDELKPLHIWGKINARGVRQNFNATLRSYVRLLIVRLLLLLRSLVFFLVVFRQRVCWNAASNKQEQKAGH